MGGRGRGSCRGQGGGRGENSKRGTSCKCHSSSSCAQEDQDLFVILKACEGRKGGSLKPRPPRFVPLLRCRLEFNEKIGFRQSSSGRNHRGEQRRHSLNKQTNKQENHKHEKKIESIPDH